jgi:hypothetical protein
LFCSSACRFLHYGLAVASVDFLPDDYVYVSVHGFSCAENLVRLQNQAERFFCARLRAILPAFLFDFFLLQILRGFMVRLRFEFIRYFFLLLIPFCA